MRRTPRFQSWQAKKIIFTPAVAVDHDYIYERPNTGKEFKGCGGESDLHPLEQIIPCHARHAVVSDDEIHINLLQQLVICHGSEQREWETNRSRRWR